MKITPDDLPPPYSQNNLGQLWFQFHQTAGWFDGCWRFGTMSWLGDYLEFHLAVHNGDAEALRLLQTTGPFIASVVAQRLKA